MTIRNILTDYSNERQPAVQLLDCVHGKWRLYFNQAQMPAVEENQSAQWQADFVPQLWQADMISETEPAPADFAALLADFGLTEAEIETILATLKQ